jgi:dTMP kinase
MKRALFIAFESIDGCGKSTQAIKLAKYILDLDKHNHVLFTREPYKDKNIRKILKEEEDPYTQAERLAELFVEDRRKHIKEVIIPSILRCIHVISDRYSFSTLAYQQTQGIALKELLALHKGLPIPDIIFIIDLPAEIAIERMKKDSIRKTEQKFEKNKEFIEKLRQNYLKLASLPKHNIVVINAGGKPDEIFEEQIKPAFDKVYNSKYSC